MVIPRILQKNFKFSIRIVIHVSDLKVSETDFFVIEIHIDSKYKESNQW